MDTSWKNSNILKRIREEGFPKGVVSLGRYHGPNILPDHDRSFFSVGEKIKGKNSAFSRNPKDFNYGKNSETPLLAGYSDGENFHILAYESLISLSLASYKYYVKTYKDKIDLFMDDSEDLKNFILMKKNLEKANAIWTICWSKDLSQYEAHKSNPFEGKIKSIYGWRDQDRNEFKIFPTFVWEVTSIPLTDIEFERRYDNKALQEFVRKI